MNYDVFCLLADRESAEVSNLEQCLPTINATLDGAVMYTDPEIELYVPGQVKNVLKKISPKPF